ncbi:MAG TPA: hypothetical protein VFA18_20780 [Gemmataceae bacterium]|nr:hypothetical protein [Gemmataceae bacterium]
MKRRTTRAEMQAFVRRWQRIGKLERDELRRTPAEIKLRQLAALMASVDTFGWREALSGEEDIVRQRWQRLRRCYGV